MSLTATRPCPLVSIVIPCFNQAAYLGEAIESVLGQTYQHLELIVVNDGSTDNTSRVARQYPDVVLVEQENQGLSAARNRGLRESDGELLVFLDADDRLLPGALSAGVSCLARHPASAFAYGQYQFIHADGTFMQRLEREPPQQCTYLDFLRSNRVGMHAAVIYRRWVFERVGEFDATLTACEDLELFLRVVRRFPVSEHAALVAEYRRHPHSISCNSRKMLACTRAVLDSERPYIGEDPDRLAALDYGLRRVTAYYTLRIVRSVLPPYINRSNWRRRLDDLWWVLRSHPEGFVHMPIWIPEMVQRRIKRRRAYASV